MRLVLRRRAAIPAGHGNGMPARHDVPSSALQSLRVVTGGTQADSDDAFQSGFSLGSHREDRCDGRV